ncbi:MULTISPECIES: hypothetical protein [Sorangium]
MNLDAYDDFAAGYDFCREAGPSRSAGALTRRVAGEAGGRLAERAVER